MTHRSVITLAIAGTALGLASPALVAQGPRDSSGKASSKDSSKPTSSVHRDAPVRDADGVFQNDPSSRSPFQRGPRLNKGLATNALPPAGLAVYPNSFRSIDGLLNNASNPEWGAAGIELRRVMPPQYADGHDAPSGADRPDVRTISNIMCDQAGNNMPNPGGLSDFIWQWGQFLDHDIDETPVSTPSDGFDILVPIGDNWFDPESTGTVRIPLDRSAYVHSDGIRQQINNITSFIDASNVYGSEEARANELRTNDGTGRLKTSPGDLLPFNVNGFDNAPTGTIPTYFLAGDVRANEQVGLTAMHTLFVREHNRLAQEIAGQNPGMDGDEIYNRARALVGAEMQAITFNEFLPRLLGSGVIPEYQGYQPDVNPTISNLFATAAYRVGHTMLSAEVMRLDANGAESPEGHLSLRGMFFNPSEVTTYGIDGVLRGLASKQAQTVDIFVVDDVRNFLFGNPGQGGFDLCALNLQRGRDHGLPSYNEIRVAYGLPAAAEFTDITTDPVVSARLEAGYGDVDLIDPWIGLLAEQPAGDAYVGETLRRVLLDQFLRLRDGDRFWYESYLPEHLVRKVEKTTLAQIIRLNTSIDEEIQDDVFVVQTRCLADMNGDGELDFLDISAFLAAYNAGEGVADLSKDGKFDFLDISLFVNAYSSRCAF